VDNLLTAKPAHFKKLSQKYHPQRLGEGYMRAVRDNDYALGLVSNKKEILQ